MYILPGICVVIYVVSNVKFKFEIISSLHFTDSLGSIITFVSIIISFFGVLLTILISAKDQSEIIKYFLENANKDLFVKCIKKVIFTGLMVVLISALLYMNDILSIWINRGLLVAEVWFLSRFAILTYRFTSILLFLFILEKEEPVKKDSQVVVGERKNKLNEKLKKKQL
jgi:hypothetical protein